MYIVLFNTEYMRQFEVVIRQDIFIRLVKKFGMEEAIKKVVKHFYRAKGRRRDTNRRRKSFRRFIDLTFDRDEASVKMALTKKRLLDRRFKKTGLRMKYLGRGEFTVAKTRRKRHRRSARRSKRRS